MHYSEAVPPGPRTFVVEVPPKTNVSPEVWIRKADAKVGSSTINWALTCGTREIFRKSKKLEEDLGNDTIFRAEGPTVPEAGTGAGF